MNESHKESSKITLSEQIYQKLRHDIIKQIIPCGKKLTLQALKTEFGVSHTPIREALTRLSEEGLLSYYSNCGVRVVTFTEQDVQELYQFISELDAMALTFCQYSFSHSPLLFELEDTLNHSNKLIEANDFEGWQDCSEDFHLAFYKHAHNHYLEDAARKVRAKISLLSALYRSDENVYLIQQNHQNIYDVVKDGNYHAGADLMRKHSQDNIAFALRACHSLSASDK